MGYCCVRSRSRCHVSPILMFFLLLVADFYIGHTHQLRGSDLSSFPLPPLQYVLRYLPPLSLSLSQLRV
jgi:hypothetical protein